VCSFWGPLGYRLLFKPRGVRSGPTQGRVGGTPPGGGGVLGDPKKIGVKKIDWVDIDDAAEFIAEESDGSSDGKARHDGPASEPAQRVCHLMMSTGSRCPNFECRGEGNDVHRPLMA